ncbi:Tn3 family transposase [Streptomyces sp. NPDC048710]|uniref:Tn3 family transposase n=1 Tax=unclassified Streptomyces TaxID=2593676 RepID=UPI0037175AA4
MIFGLFRLLGHQLAPRLADAGHTLLYRSENRSTSERTNPTLGALTSSTRHSDQPVQPGCHIM